MLEHDDSDDFMQGIVEEICLSALDTIYQNYLQRQLIPFTVLQAKDAMLQIVEVLFHFMIIRSETAIKKRPLLWLSFSLHTKL